MSIIVLFIIAILLAFCFILNYFSTDILEKDESDNIQPAEEDIIISDDKEDVREVEHEQNITEDSIKPNELGKVMIIMYHDISKTEGEWSRHYDNFRQDLETFYEKGYRLISIKSFLDNDINIPRGCSPMILTFDDGKGSIELY